MKISRLVCTTIVVALVVGMGSTVAVAAAPRQGQKPKAADVGITDKEIRLAVVADVDTPVVPGLFQAAVDTMRAWAKTVNQQGGIAGRKVVIDFLDSKLSGDEARNAVIKACAEDFAMVGGEALFLNNVDDMVACKNAQGEAVGLPDMPGLALDNAQKCSPVSYIASGDTKFCSTINDHPQTYYPQQGDFRYYLSQNKNLHGVFTLPSDVKAASDAQLVVFQAGVDLGVKKDDAGFYDVSARSQQSVLTPIVKVIKDNSSTFVYNGSSFAIMAMLRREAKLQGVDSVKVWACNQGCYDNEFLKQGGSDVEGTTSILTSLPFYSEYKANPTLKTIVKELGGPDKVTGNSVNALVAGLLFQDAAAKAIAGGGTLDRASLLAALKAEHDFDANGIIGPTNIGNRDPQQCIVLTEVKNGKWVRIHPTKVDTFDCSKKNIAKLQLDLIK
jgi:hypothetical protein